VEHYIAYRAHVRAKVARLCHAQGDPDAANEAAMLLTLAVRHLERGRVRMVLVGGLPGTGKTTVGTALADATGWSLLRSDEVRRDQTASDLLELRCEAPMEVAAVRLASRQSGSGDLSDATVSTIAAMAGDFHDWPGAVVVDTSSDLGASLAIARAAVCEPQVGSAIQPYSRRSPGPPALAVVVGSS